MDFPFFSPFAVLLASPLAGKVLLLLAALGTAPSRVFGWSVTPASPNVAMKGAAWIR